MPSPVPDQNSYLYLTTRGRTSGLPREIEIWFTRIRDTFYIVAEYETSRWVKNIQASPEVRVRVNEFNFTATARIISPHTDPELHRAVQNLSREKYGWGDGLVVELKPLLEGDVIK